MRIVEAASLPLCCRSNSTTFNTSSRKRLTFGWAESGKDAASTIYNLQSSIVNRQSPIVNRQSAQSPIENRQCVFVVFVFFAAEFLTTED
ncbi:MAG: hypothetical protein NTZ09_08655 [Candidatus Hydrogenedentes bacterium]|nr:hypothetical protein [Candidatus Hydrogenedentota bacterium]